MSQEILDLYQRCLKAKYIHVENDGDYALERKGGILYLYLQWSHGKVDWRNNFNFWAKPYKRMGCKWYCHRGFLKVWKSIEPYIKNEICDPTVKGVVIVGYSHGAALAGLAHEYVWFNRPDLRSHLVGLGFGAPRFYWGFRVKTKLKERWANFHPIRNIDDIVTHLPPAAFGFCHVNKLIKIGKKGKFNKISAHYSDSYIATLSTDEKERKA